MTPTADKIKELREAHPCISLADAKKLVTLASTPEEAHSMAERFLAGGSIQDLMLEQIASLKTEQHSEKLCKMEDCGDYRPNHEFKRLQCSVCGAMHWEQPQSTLPRMRYCPWCGRKVIDQEKHDG